MSTNVNLAAGSGVDLFRLRTAANGGIIKVFVAANGTLQVRSDFSSTTRTTTTALGTGWHNVELCGTVGSATTWNLYRDGTQILTNWVADTGTTPVGRIQLGDTAAKTFTVNFDHVVLDTAPGDDVTGDLTAPSVPGRPAGSSPSAGSIQISWAGSTDPAPASLPITYRVYRDGGATSVDHHHVVHRYGPGRRFEPHLHGRRDRRGEQRQREEPGIVVDHRFLRRRHDAPDRPGPAYRHEPDHQLDPDQLGGFDRRVAPDHVPRLSRRRRDLGRVDDHHVLHRHRPGRRLESHLRRRRR
jgi:hypothetical protein